MPGPDPAVAAVRSAVRRVLAPVPRGGLVLAACSGGADSVALLSALAWEAPRSGVRFGVVHVDHRLAASSGAVAAAVRALAKELRADVVECSQVLVDGASGDGPEASARTARYAALERTATLTEADLVLLGHTLDDQAECVLLGLARGSGARSLAGMPVRRDVFARPLLALRRAQLRQYCTALRLPVWEDPSNADQTLTRNRVRSVVLPTLERELGPGVAEALARTADQLRDDADALDAATAAAYDGLAIVARDTAELTVELPVVGLEQLPAAVRRRVLQRAAIAVGVPAGSLGSVHLLAAERLVTGWRGQGAVALPGGGAVTRHGASLYVVPMAAATFL